ncbi:MAG: hypothetical protein HQL50_08000 [Magnetococcales bacterium]|nr:hypothetical protein [Magnetococcales bacterium]
MHSFFQVIPDENQPTRRRGMWFLILLLVCTLSLPLPWHTADAGEIKGVTLTSWGYNALDEPSTVTTLKWLRCLGTTDIAISTENLITGPSATILNKWELTGPDKRLAVATRAARSMGMNVTIKPHYLLESSSDHLAYPAYKPYSWNIFFSNLTENVLAHARIAQSAGANRLVIGTEMGGHITGRKHRAKWSRLIRKVRTIFTGKLTYAATTSTIWPDSESANEAKYVAFWDLLDEVGVTVYPSLTKNQHPTKDQLKRAFFRNDEGHDSIAPLRELYTKTGKPVVVLEAGARSIKGNFWETGSWQGTSQTIDNDAQTKLLTASLEIWMVEMKKPWLTGLFLWEAMAYERHGENREWWDTDYTFQHKPAMEVVKRFYAPGGSPTPMEPACRAFPY